MTQPTTETVNGLTLEQWAGLLNTNMSVKAKRALNYYDGLQEEETIKLLNDPNRGRKEWQQRGFIPRYRNITKMVVDKSGLIFKDAMPVFDIYQDKDTVNEQATQLFNDALWTLEFQETLVNLDAVVRLLKSACLLFQTTEYGLTTDILHPGNAQVVLDQTTKQPTGLIYEISKSDSVQSYRVITDLEVIDLEAVNGTISITSRVINSYGFIPICVFYDTSTPRNTFWNPLSSDLISMNEMLNLHLTDAEFAISWAVRPTLFTNCKFVNEGGSTNLEVSNRGSKLPRLEASLPTVLGGPDRGIYLDSHGVDGPFIEYKTPNVEITAVSDAISGWISSVSQDWSVKIKTAGEGSANSGFQLVVEELDNLTLRQLRQKMFANGFKRMYKVLSKLSVFTGLNMPYEYELFATFNDPKLPVNQKENEEVWSIRITEGRATVIDYFMQEKDMSKEEAEKKWQEIKQFQDINKPKEEVINKEPALKKVSSEEPLTD